MIVWKPHRSWICSLAYHPAGTSLATATGSGRYAYLWDPKTGKSVRKLDGANTVYAVAFAPDAPLFAVGTKDGIRLWRTDSWEVLGHLPLRKTFNLAFGRGPTPPLVASCDRPDNAITVWPEAINTATGRARKPDLQLAVGGYGGNALAFSPDGKILATNNTVWGVMFWDVATGEQMRVIKHSLSAGPLAFSPDGTRIAFGCGKSVEVWAVEATPTEPLLRFDVIGEGPILAHTWATNWSHDGRMLITAGNDGRVRLWDATTGAALRSFDWGIGKIRNLAVSPDGLTCAAGGNDGQVVVWDLDG